MSRVCSWIPPPKKKIIKGIFGTLAENQIWIIRKCYCINADVLRIANSMMIM